MGKLTEWCIKRGLSPTATKEETNKFMEDVVPTLKKYSIMELARLLADNYIGRKMGLSWEDMADTNSLYNYVDEGIEWKELITAVKEACDERIMTDMHE